MVHFTRRTQRGLAVETARTRLTEDSQMARREFATDSQRAQRGLIHGGPTQDPQTQSTRGNAENTQRITEDSKGLR